MGDKSKRILIACYGGGHVQSLIPIARRLFMRTDVELIVIGFTTARAEFERAGINALGYDCLLDDNDKEWLELAAIYLPEDTHPDITKSETLAYHAIGLRDLVLSYGKEVALNRFAEYGRKAFLPQLTFSRYLDKITPDLVITSTSPRSELALQCAATCMGIETLAVSDLFLQHESKYICAANYARNVTVMAEYVADFLKRNGYNGNVHVTGNPAFDSLSSINMEDGYRLREQLGIRENERLILWVCPSASASIIGKPFVKPSVMLGFLEDLCAKYADMRYLVRQHPSNPVIDNVKIRIGALCSPLISIEDCLSAADLVLLETSTVGLQAALLGLPVVTIDAGDYPPYAQLGLSVDVPDINSAEEALLEARKPKLDSLSYPALGCATELVMKVIYNLLNMSDIEQEALN